LRKEAAWFMDRLPVGRVIDAHCHLFSPAVIDNVERHREPLGALHLDFGLVRERLTPESLLASAASAGVDRCLLLFTADRDRIPQANRRALELHADDTPLSALGTAHPELPRLEQELQRLARAGTRGLKFSSFSQAIDFSGGGAFDMLEMAQGVWQAHGMRLAVILDTFVRADEVFGTAPRFLTRPATLAALVRRFPGIDFVGAHMGGLAADFAELARDLPPAENLFLDTANAAHTLTGEPFVLMLRRHGAARVLFGTDWPWFGHAEEIPKILDLLNRADFDEADARAVMRENAARLLFPAY
jgi:predicted TIM-barrel fold metal-dependent hydrolase